MLADPEDVVHVVPLLRKRLHHAIVLHKPVAILVVAGTVRRKCAIVIASVLQKDADRFLLALANDVGIGVAAPQIDEAADGAEHLAELIGPVPSYRERSDRSGTGPADPVP